MSMCCCISGEPVEDPSGRLKTKDTSKKFQVGMMDAPCVDGWKSWGWFCGQFIPITCGCTQYQLRMKVLHNDLTKYSCFQGYFDVCCIKAGTCGESDCPQLCLFCESCVCNCVAVSASRTYVMEKYELSSDECDYRLIRINNCLQIFACFCTILALIDSSFNSLARIISLIADCFYHMVSGCMTAQVAHEQNYQDSIDNPSIYTPVIKASPVEKTIQ